MSQSGGYGTHKCHEAPSKLNRLCWAWQFPHCFIISHLYVVHMEPIIVMSCTNPLYLYLCGWGRAELSSDSSVSEQQIKLKFRVNVISILNVDLYVQTKTHMHACMYTPLDTQTCMRYAFMHEFIHTQIHTYIHTIIYTCKNRYYILHRI